jgi:SIR2-like domain
MSIVYFLGAGFSAAYGLPVMKQFFPVARQDPLLNKLEQRFLEEVQHFANMGVRLVTISRNNMEEILSFLEMADQAGQVPHRLKELCILKDKSVLPSEMLRSIIARIYGPWKLPDLNLKSLSIYTALTFGFYGDDPRTKLAPIESTRDYWQPEHFKLPPNLTIITTNYDLCLETQFLHINPELKFRLPGNWVSSEGHPQGKGDQSGIYDPKSPMTLLRLHGAVNWQMAGYKINDQTYDILVHSGLKTNNTPFHIYNDMYDNNLPPPILVAPTILKHQAEGPYAQQWKEAAKALSEAKHLIFIGYSFPESDAYMRYFLGASLVENVGLESIIIVDPHANAIVERLSKDKRYGDHFTDMLIPYQRCWQQN